VSFDVLNKDPNSLNLPEKSEPSTSPDRIRTLLLHAAIWSVFIACAFSSKYFVVHGLYFEGVWPVPLRVNPLLFSLGIVGLGVASLLFGLFVANLSGKPILAPVIACAAILLSVCSVLGSIQPSKGALVVRDRVQSPYQKPAKPVFAIPVLFRNGQFRMDRLQRSTMIQNLRIFGTCGSGTLYVRGFASSARYPPSKGDSNNLNKNLANNRAEEVQMVLHKFAHIEAKLLPAWHSYPEMVAERRLIDEAGGKRLKDMEALNRRVEIFWEETPCNLRTDSPGNEH
jgi:hypothetical protein